jgi:hypothetical protein
VFIAWFRPGLKGRMRATVGQAAARSGAVSTHIKLLPMLKGLMPEFCGGWPMPWCQISVRF